MTQDVSRVRVPPFLFTGYGDPGEEMKLPAPDFVDQRVQHYKSLIALSQAKGSETNVKFARGKAVSCLAYKTLSWNQREKLEQPRAMEAADTVAFLLNMAAGGSKESILLLKSLTEQLLKGLFTLTAHGNSEATATLFDSLGLAVGELGSLMDRTPERFLPFTRKANGIVGIISPLVEQADYNEDLLERLEVGKDYPVKGRTKHGGSKLKTPANEWANRLIAYILEVREKSEAILKVPPEHRRFQYGAGWYTPNWLDAALALRPFSPETCLQWFEVAWTIVEDATGKQPEQQKQLMALQKRPAQQGKASKRSGKILPTPPSKMRGDIKTALKLSFKKLARQENASNVED